MNIKQMAIVQTLKIVAAAAIGAVTGNVILELSPFWGGMIITALIAGYLIRELYLMQLQRLDSENSLKKLKDLG